MDPALLPDITTTYEHMQKSDGTLGLVEKASSGRMSPIRKRSVKDVEQQIEKLEKENFDLKLRIYFLEQQKGINKDDTLKVNIDLRVQLQSIHEEFQRKQDTWEQMMSGYENHIQELEQQVHKDRSSQVTMELHSLKEKLADSQNSLRDMEQLLNDKAFESETQLQAANSEIEKLKERLADRERQLMTSPSQEDLLALKHALDERESELEDKTLLLHTVNQQVHDLEHQLKQVAEKMSETCLLLSERDTALANGVKELSEKEKELHAVRDELRQRDFSLKKAQIDLQALQTAATSKNSDAERVRADLTRQFASENKSILSQLEAAQQTIHGKATALASRDEELSSRDMAIKNLNSDVNSLKQQLQSYLDKYEKDVTNLQQKVHQLQEALHSRDLEIQSLRKQSELEGRSDKETLQQLRDSLAEKDRTIASLIESVRQKNGLLAERADQPDCTSSPRESTNPALTHLCMEMEQLRKENNALRAGRPIDFSGDDIDIDTLSDSSEARDLIHSQLAKHNARAQVLQAKLLEMSREDVDGGSESSSLLREQISALMRMRESDKKVIDALKKHISVNSAGEFDPEVVSNLAADVHRLSGKIKEMHRNGMRSSRSTGSQKSHRSGCSSSSSVYREEIEHLKKELDSTRHEASKSKAELHKLSDESAVVSKLQATEALVRQQAEEKKRLLEQLAYYKSLLEAAGLLPKPPMMRYSSVGNLGQQTEREEERHVSKRASSEERKPSKTTYSDEGALEMQKLGSGSHNSPHPNIPVVSKSAPSHHSRIPVLSQSAVKGEASPSAQQSTATESTEDLQSIIEHYREEVEAFGRPAELSRQTDELGRELSEVQNELSQALESNKQIKESYEGKLVEKDIYIDELEEKIRQLQAQLKALYAGDMSGSMTLDLPGSRPPSSLHSVPAERASSRVVSLNGAALHDRSTSGVVADRSTLSFSGSAHPGYVSPFENGNVTLNSSFNKTGEESGICRGGSRPSTCSSTRSQGDPPVRHISTIGEDDAGSRSATYFSQDEISPVQGTDGMYGKTLSPLTEVSSALSKGSGSYRDSGLDTSHRTDRSKRDGIRSAASLIDTLDGTAERLRRDDSFRLNDAPSLGGTLLPTQENLLNTSTDSINKLALEHQAQKPYSVGSPQKGPVHSPTVSRSSDSPSGDTRQWTSRTTERYEKRTSPSRQIFPKDEPSASWQLTTDERFSGDKHLSRGDYDQSQRVGRDVLMESTQTDTDDFKELGERLVQALNKEDSLKDRRNNLADIHKEYEEALRKAQDESEELRSRLSEAESEAEAHLTKRLETAEIANELQQQLLEKANTLQMVRQRYEEELVASADKVRHLTEELCSAKESSGKLDEELRNSQLELKSVNEALAESSRRFKDVSQQLRKIKEELREAETATHEAKQVSSEACNALEQTQRDLRASCAELRLSRDALADKTNEQVVLTKQLRQAELDRDEFADRVVELQAQVDDYEQALPVMMSAKSGKRNSSTARVPSVKRLQDEITSILDTSEHIRSNLASALEQSVLNDSHAAEGDHASLTATPKSGMDGKLIELLKLNLVRVEQLNERITELLDVEQEALLAVRSAQIPTENVSGEAVYRLPNKLTESDKTTSRGHIEGSRSRATGENVAVHGDAPLNRSQNNAADRSVSNDISFASDAGAPEVLTINGVTYQQVADNVQQSPTHHQYPVYSTAEALERSLPQDIRDNAAANSDLKQTPTTVPVTTGPFLGSPSENLHYTSQSLPSQFRNKKHPPPVSAGCLLEEYSGSQLAADPSKRLTSTPLQPSFVQSSQTPATTHGKVSQPLVTRGQLWQPTASTQSYPSQSTHGQLPPVVAFDQTLHQPAVMHDNSGDKSVKSYPQYSVNSMARSHPSNLDIHDSSSPFVNHTAYKTQPVPTSTPQPGRQADMSANTGPTSAVSANDVSASSQHAINSLPTCTTSVPHSPGKLQDGRVSYIDVPAKGIVPNQTTTGGVSYDRVDIQLAPHVKPTAGGMSKGERRGKDISQGHVPHRNVSPNQFSASHQSDHITEGYTEPTQQPTGQQDPPMRVNELYEPTVLSEVYQYQAPPALERQTKDLPSSDELPSTRGSLHAVSSLVNYELLKKQNEESLVLLSGLEARIQGRLDGFTSASPLEVSFDMEWCTLKELKSTAQNLRTTLFAEKKYITQFDILELPSVHGKRYEEMLRSYRKLESRYDWAKAQLMELMKATKFDEDLVAQMKRVKSILKASKENIKMRTYTPERLRQKPV
ncbi:putative leucine-rich repeat-containing protein DDB_G0290503 [Watersipora subatra]|uniref:putative leucine-rich repeat-containing protein DDB_G0290503 n=1 Tax=Watersipora subatra TaxID=2589382 RepID=UPI00355B318D